MNEKSRNFEIFENYLMNANRSTAAYIGARAIVKGLENGADIIICGRVADASPVIGAAWWWYGWSDTDYDRLAGAFLAGHLIECSAYASGSNFSGFHRYPLETFVDNGFPIAEIEQDGACVITKHEGTGGMVSEDTVRTIPIPLTVDMCRDWRSSDVSPLT